LGKIKLLSDEIINQIAAGEIVERPASALKEIVENSIDAASKNICVFLGNGGKSKIVVEDDGEGLSRDDLLLSIKRHATSKMRSVNLFDIQSYGFRGEALPSIASVSSFAIESNGFGISVNFSEPSDVYPSSIASGTRVTVSNIFGSTPARLKFLKSDNSELSACLSVIENFALVRDDVDFEVRSGNQLMMSFKKDTLDERVSKIFGPNLFEKSVYFDENNELVSAKGYLFHPLDSKYSTMSQKIFINGRAVKDKFVSLALRNAYRDLLPSGRFAAAVVFIDIDPFYVDVNVSPTKSEVRFRDHERVQKVLTDFFRKKLNKFDKMPMFSYVSFGNNAIDTAPQPVLRSHEPIHELIADRHLHNDRVLTMKPPAREESPEPYNANIEPIALETPKGQELIEPKIVSTERNEQKQFAHNEQERFFGSPVCQIFNMYIIAEKQDAIVIIDQHAVHEKITQEKMKNDLRKDAKQYLVRPETIELTDKQREFAVSIKTNLEDVGFSIDIVQNLLFIHAIPSILPQDAASSFITNVLETENTDLSPVDMIKSSIASIACHGSIRAGRKLTLDEMNALLNEMERTDSIHQCNHNRPSFTIISKGEIGKLFKRNG
jgi:DNA mismatch repair protein MutL